MRVETRDILPLEPDLLLSSHGFNGLPLLETVPRPALVPPSRERHGSALLSEVEFRFRLARFAAAQRGELAAIPSVEQALTSRYAELYRKLIRLGKEHDFAAVLATSALAVTPASPSAVIEFYSRVFPNMLDEAAANAVHNRMVERIAAETGTPLIDVTPQLNGEWDAGLFVDPMHFTQKGARLVASHMFACLKPILQGDPTLRGVETP
jgi:lysophospholipase L1-like esterase